MSTAIASQTSWVSPLSTPDVIDVDGSLTPRCPRRRITITEHEDVVARRRQHREAQVRREVAVKQRGKTELSEAENRALFSSHPSIDPTKFVGRKLTRRQRAQLKVIKKQLRNG